MKEEIGEHPLFPRPPLQIEIEGRPPIPPRPPLQPPIVRKLGEISSSIEWLNPTQYIRELDCLRLYKPNPEERSRLNIPDSIERLNLHDRQHFLSACGFSRGIRFTSNELPHATRLTQSLAQAFAIVNEAFQRLTPASKKISARRMADEQGRDEADDLEAFFLAGKAYLDLYREAMNLIRLKHEDLAIKLASNVTTLAPGKDAEDAIQSSLPHYLSVLIQKYNRESGCKVNRGITSKGIDSIGNFISFLIYSCWDANHLTEQEKDSLAELLFASDDGQKVNPPWSPSSKQTGTSRHHCSQRYWANRFYAFLSTLPELKSVPKNPKGLKDFASWPRIV